jgi:hypothetical protein
MYNKFCVSFIFALLIYLSNAESEYKWREEYYRGMPIDHFSNKTLNGTKTFDLKYLINDAWWKKDVGPIFFYPGNEGPIEEFAENTVIVLLHIIVQYCLQHGKH